MSATTSDAATAVSPEWWEVIVVGGGPAGAAAAWELTRNGVRALVLDRAAFPREKLCAGWITPEVLVDLELTPDEYPHGLLTFEVLKIAVRGWRRRLRSRQHSIRRYEFDRWLVERSGAPVEVHNVRRVTPVDGGYRLDDRYHARHLIGAGGTRCPVARELFRQAQPRLKSLQVVTQELEFPHHCATRDCHLWFFDEGLPGYGWYVPKADGYLNIGVGGAAGVLRRRGDTIQRHWRLLVSRLLEQGLVRAEPGNPGGYSYFLRGSTGPLRRDNAYLVGDAAGLATRDMCEGIGPAVRSGIEAARSILGRSDFAAAEIGRHTLTNPLARLTLDYLIAARG